MLTLKPRNKLTEVIQPSKKTFDFPAPIISSKRPAILSLNSLIASARSYYLDSSLPKKTVIETIAIICFVTNQSLWVFIDETTIQRLLYEPDFMRRSTCNANGDRKTSAVCDRHDLGALSAFGLANAKPPFFAAAKLPSMNVSVKSIPPRSRRSVTSARKTLSSVSSSTYSWNCRKQVGYDEYRSGGSFHGAPVLNIHKIPLRTSRGYLYDRPRPSFRRRCFGNSGAMISHCSFVKSIHSLEHIETFLSIPSEK